MKDKILQLRNGDFYYILEEVDYLDKSYLLAAQCDVEKNNLCQKDLVLMELVVNGDTTIVEEVTDDNVAKNIIEKFQLKYLS